MAKMFKLHIVNVLAVFHPSDKWCQVHTIIFLFKYVWENVS